MNIFHLKAINNIIMCNDSDINYNFFVVMLPTTTFKWGKIILVFFLFSNQIQLLPFAAGVGLLAMATETKNVIIRWSIEC